MAKIDLPDTIRVGSFFLETLTTGMYENPFDCLREYVQNGFDAINDAIRASLIASGDGRLTITTSGAGARQNIAIRDNGAGIPKAEAVERLISLGASTKRPAKHAGFRGIGRLAGIAYCGTLRFTTKAAGEEEAIQLDFDCAKIRGFMGPGAVPRDVREVITQSVTATTLPARNGEHYTEVQMLALTGIGLDFVQPGPLTNYLRQYAPTDYSAGFDFGEQVRKYAEGSGHPLQFIEIELRIKRDRTRITKPYSNAYPSDTGEEVSVLDHIETIGNPENGWFGWFGISNFPGEIPDNTVAGLRFRQKNIQIGGSGIIESIAAKLTPKGSERRLQRWAVGEIFVVNPSVVPNARRDGFEDNLAWRRIKDDLQQIAGRIVKFARSSSKNRSKLARAGKAIAATRQKLTSIVSAAEAGVIDAELKAQLDKIEKAVRDGANPAEASELIAQIRDIREDITTASHARTQSKEEAEQRTSSPPPPKSVLEVVEEVLIAKLGTKVATDIMAAVHERLAK